MTKDEAMKLALEALALRFSEGWHEGIKIDASDIMLLNDAAQALAAPVQHEMTPEMMRKVQMHSELGAYAAENLSGAYDLFQEFWRVAMSAAPQPAQRTWVGLTDEEREALWYRFGYMELMRAIEAKLKEKNT